MCSDEKTLDIVSMPCKKTKYECKGCFQPLWMLLQTGEEQILMFIIRHGLRIGKKWEDIMP